MTTQPTPTRAEHTPGPWRVYHREAVKFPGIDTDDFGNIVVWGGEFDDGGVRGCTQEECIANAHLIAAAPDLYAALYYLWGNIEKSHPEYSDSLPMREARAAIAKATGEGA